MSARDVVEAESAKDWVLRSRPMTLLADALKVKGWSPISFGKQLLMALEFNGASYALKAEPIEGELYVTVEGMKHWSPISWNPTLWHLTSYWDVYEGEKNADESVEDYADYISKEVLKDEPPDSPEMKEFVGEP